MKSFNWKTLAMLFLLFATWWLPACERVDLLPDHQQVPAVQGAWEEEDELVRICDCDNSCRSFSQSITVSAGPSGYDFAVVLKHTGGCDNAFLAGQKCRFMGKRYSLSFKDDPDYGDKFQLSNYSRIVRVSSHNSDPIDVPVTPTQTVLSLDAGDSVTLYFKFKTGIDVALPRALYMHSGGICIIGILTEPCPPPCQFPDLYPPNMRLIPRPFRPER